MLRWLALILCMMLLHSVRAQDKQGLLAQYYNGIDFEQFVLSRVEDKIDFWRELKSPCPGVGEEFFSIRWTGSIYAPATGIYTFHLAADDGIRLWVNNTKLIEGWYDQMETSYSGSILLEKGQYYDLRVDYYNSVIHSILKLTWEMPPEIVEVFGEKVQLNYDRRVKIPSEYLIPSRSERKQPPSLVFRPDPDELPAVVAQTLADDRPVTSAVQNKKKEVVGEYRIHEAMILKDVNFEQQKDQIPTSAFHELDKLTVYLTAHPTVTIEIRGHTDFIGDSIDNQILSENRAKAVADYLVNGGISRLRIKHTGLGGRYPLVESKNTDRIRNRRVEFILRD